MGGGGDRDGRKVEKYDIQSSLPALILDRDTHLEHGGSERPKSAVNGIHAMSGLDGEKKKKLIN